VTRWRKLYVVAVLGWTLSAILALVLLGSFPYELFFVLSVIGFLTVMVLAHRFT
jgi:uncharacterized membrane protein